MGVLERLQAQMIEIEDKVSELCKRIDMNPDDAEAQREMKALIEKHAELVRQYLAAPPEDCGN